MTQTLSVVRSVVGELVEASCREGEYALICTHPSDSAWVFAKTRARVGVPPLSVLVSPHTLPPVISVMLVGRPSLAFVFSFLPSACHG